MKKRNNLKIIKLILLLFFCRYFVLYADETKFKNSNQQVYLTGKLSQVSFFDANGKMEKVFVLKLRTPVHAMADAFGGPVNNVEEVQIVSGQKVTTEKYLDKIVEVSGHLFYPITAHHHTKILMRVESIRILRE